MPSEIDVTKDPRRGRVAVALWLLAIVGFGVLTLDRAVWHQNPKTDFTVYRLAAEAILQGKDIYAVQNVRGWNYVYPPLFAILMVAFVFIPVWLGVVLFYLVSVLCVWHAVRLCAAFLEQSRLCGEAVAGRLSLGALVLLASPLLGGLVRGQASVPMLWLFMAAIGWERRRPAAAGCCLAGAALLKVFPAAMLGYYAWRARWRFIGWCLAALVVGGVVLPAAAIGVGKTIGYWREWVHLVGGPALNAGGNRAASPLFEQLLSPDKLRNQSLDAVFSRLINPAAGDWLTAALGLVSAGVMLWRFRRRKESPFALGAAICWVLLISPVAEGHYFIILLLPLAVAFAYGVAGAQSRWGRIVAGVGAGAFALGELLDATSDLARALGALCWGTVVLWMALLFLPGGDWAGEAGGLKAE